MIFVDHRAGSNKLYPKFPKGMATLTELEFSDVSFIGKGPVGSVAVGIEVKNVSDVLACVSDGRFSGHQLPGLVSNFDYVWLVIQGLYRANPTTGVLQTPAGRGNWKDISYGRRFMYRDLECWLISMEVCAGIKIRKTGSEKQTADFCQYLHRWFTYKEYEDHRAHLAANDSTRPPLLVDPDLVTRVAKEFGKGDGLSGLGWKKAARVSEHFRTVREMVEADQKEWEKIAGIGKTLSQRIVGEINGDAGS